jgi:hypothetical protein
VISPGRPHICRVGFSQFRVGAATLWPGRRRRWLACAPRRVHAVLQRDPVAGDGVCLLLRGVPMTLLLSLWRLADMLWCAAERGVVVEWR